MVLAIAYPNPWSSAFFYLPSQSLADSRWSLQPSCHLVVFPLSSFSLLSLPPFVSSCAHTHSLPPPSRRSRLPRPATPPPPADPLLSLSAQLCPPRGIFWPLEVPDCLPKQMKNRDARQARWHAGHLHVLHLELLGGDPTRKIKNLRGSPLEALIQEKNPSRCPCCSELRAVHGARVCTEAYRNGTSKTTSPSRG